MMKKYSLIAALVIALTFAFVGCSGTLEKDDGGDGPATPPPFTTDLVSSFGTGGEWKVVLKQTDYSDGVQEQIGKADLMQGNTVTTGDEYTFDLKFKVDRVPTENILIYLVDNTEAANSYWRKLTPVLEIDKDELTAGTEYEIKEKITAIGTASSAAVDANKLCIETQEGKKPTVVADLTMTFSKFTFSRGEGGTPPPPPPPPVSKTLGDLITLEGITPAPAWLSTEITTGTDFADVGPLFVGNGAPKPEWVDNDGALALKVSGVENWHGITIDMDLFEEGDIIEVKGRLVITAEPPASTNREIMLAANTGWNPAPGAGSHYYHDHLGAGTHPFTLTSDALTSTFLEVSGATGIRIQTNNPVGTIPNYFIDSIKITRE